MAFDVQPENMIERQIERSIGSVKELLEQAMGEMRRSMDGLTRAIEGLQNTVAGIDKRQAQTDVTVNNLSEKFIPIEDKLRTVESEIATLKGKSEKTWDFKAYLAAGAIAISTLTGGSAGVAALTGGEPAAKAPDAHASESAPTPAPALTREDLEAILQRLIPQEGASE